MKQYTFNQLSAKAKDYAIAMHNKYNNPKKLDAVTRLKNSVWTFNSKGEIYNGLTN